MSEPSVRRSRSALGVLAVLVTAGMVLTMAAGCGGLPDEVYKLDKACGGTKYDDATPYAGKGPHRVAVFMPSEFGQLLPDTPELQVRSAAVDGYSGDPDTVQLVACGTLKSAQRSGDCAGYGAIVGRSTSVPMTRATYRIRVYELRTHREVRSAVVQGADTKCPSVISANSIPKRFLSGLTNNQWQSVLDDLVERNLR